MNTSTGISAWAGLGVRSTSMPAAPLGSTAPKPQHQGSGLPFAGYATTDLAVLSTVVRTADAKVPDPRGPQR